jgi:hypothetical protein
MHQGHEAPAPIRTVRSANFMRRSSSMTDGVNPRRNHVESQRCTNVLRIESFPRLPEGPSGSGSHIGELVAPAKN